MKKEFKSSKKLLFEMLEKVNNVKPQLNETFKIMGSYMGRPKEVLDTAESESEANYLKKEYVMAYGKDFKVWIESDGKKFESETYGTPNPLGSHCAKPLNETESIGTEPVSVSPKFRAEVTGKGENVWSNNAVEYDTEEEAKKWLDGLSNRWFGYDMSRVVPTTTPPRQPVDMEKDILYQNFRR
jgi:hypothetical protein